MFQEEARRDRVLSDDDGPMDQRPGNRLVNRSTTRSLTEAVSDQGLG
jgi:hypothetical protein